MSDGGPAMGTITRRHLSFGAAAAVGDLRKPDEYNLAHAFAVATTLTPGLQQAVRRDEQAAASGKRRRGGTVAALAADKGFTATLDVLVGLVSLGAAIADCSDWSALAREMSDEPHGVTDTVKTDACCGQILAAAAELQLCAYGVQAALPR